MLPIIWDNYTHSEYGREYEIADDVFKAPFPPTANNAIGCYMTSVALLSMLGNFAVWLSFLPKRDALLPIDYLTLNLALSDFLVALICWPMAISSAFKQRWSWGQRGCTFYGFTSFFLIMSSLSTITAIAFLRYLKMCRQKIHDYMLYKLVFRLLIFIWIYSLITALLPVLGWSRYSVEPYRISCAPNWSGRGLSNISFSFFVTTQCLVVPVTVCFFCYAAIFKKIYRRKMGTRSRRRSQMQQKLIRSAFAVTVCYMISWTPYAIVSLWHSVYGENSVSLWASAIPVVVAKSTSLFNPTIYLVFNTTFRQDTKEIMQCCGCRCCCVSVNDNPDDWLRVVKIQKTATPPDCVVKQRRESGDNRFTSVRPLPRSPCFYKKDDLQDAQVGLCGRLFQPTTVGNELGSSNSSQKRVPLANIEEFNELEPIGSMFI